MNIFNDYSFANLSQEDIDAINNTQTSIKQKTNEDIVLIAYKKNKTAE